MKQEWKEAADAKRQQFLDKARATKEAIAEAKRESQRKNNEWMERKRASAREEKANDAVALGSLANEVARNTQMRRQQYSRRYVSMEEAEAEFEAADTFRKLYNL